MGVERLLHLRKHIEHVIKAIDTEVPYVCWDNYIVRSNESALRQ